MRILAGLLIITTVCITVPVNAAIFSGGSGDGSATGNSGSSTLNGNVGASHKFTGGIGDGFSSKGVIFTPPASVDKWLNYESTSQPAKL